MSPGTPTTASPSPAASMTVVHEAGILVGESATTIALTRGAEAPSASARAVRSSRTGLSRPSSREASSTTSSSAGAWRESGESRSWRARAADASAENPIHLLWGLTGLMSVWGSHAAHRQSSAVERPVRTATPMSDGPDRVADWHSRERARARACSRGPHTPTPPPARSMGTGALTRWAASMRRWARRLSSRSEMNSERDSRPMKMFWATVRSPIILSSWWTIEIPASWASRMDRKCTGAPSYSKTPE